MAARAQMPVVSRSKVARIAAGAEESTSFRILVQSQPDGRQLRGLTFYFHGQRLVT